MSGEVVLVGGVDVTLACLDALIESGIEPELVVGYADARAQASGYVDIAGVAESRGLGAIRTSDINAPTTADAIQSIDAALMFVIGWSQLVGPELLGAPRYGSVGIHPTDLPTGRGRAPIPWTILKQLRTTASTLFFLTEGVDDGDVIDRVQIDVDARETAGTLYAKHRAAHAELVRGNAYRLLRGTAPSTRQDHAKATYWPKRSPEDGRIDWSADAEAIDRLVRAVTRPFPGAFTEIAGDPVTIWSGEPVSRTDLPPGRLVKDGDGTFVGCGSGAVRVCEADGPGFKNGLPEANTLLLGAPAAG